MSEIKRFICIRDEAMQEAPDGDWRTNYDYAALEQENAKLEAKVDELEAELAAKNTALGVDEVDMLEEMKRMEGEISALREKLEEAKGLLIDITRGWTACQCAEHRAIRQFLEKQ